MLRLMACIGDILVLGQTYLQTESSKLLPRRKRAFEWTAWSLK